MTAGAAGAGSNRWITRARTDLLRRAGVCALAAAVALLVSEAIGLSDGYWAVITAIIVAEPLVGVSFATARSRLLATAFGAALGTVALATLGGNVVALALSVAVTMVACGLVGLEAGARLAAATAAVVVLVPGPTAWETGLDRTVDIAVGIGTAGIVSLLAFPIRARGRLRDDAAATLRRLGGVLDELVGAYVGGRPPGEGASAERTTAVGELAALRTLGAAVDEEPMARGLDHVAVLNAVDRLLGDLERLDELVQASRGDTIGARLREPLEGLARACGGGLELCAATLAGANPRPGVPDLAMARLALDDVMGDMRRTRETTNYPLAEVTRAVTVQHHLARIADCVERLLATIRESSRSVHPGL